MRSNLAPLFLAKLHVSRLLWKTTSAHTVENLQSRGRTHEKLREGEKVSATTVIPQERMNLIFSHQQKHAK